VNYQPVQASASPVLKVLHLLAPARFGGLERVVHALATGQKATGHDVEVVMLLERDVAEPPLANELHDAGVPVIRVVRAARAFRAQRNLVRDICRQAVPDILHSHGYLPDVLAASLGRNFPAARVSTVHGFTGGKWRNRFYEWLQRRSYVRFDAVIAVSKKLAFDLTPRASTEALHMLPNAWMPTEEPLSPETACEALSLSLGVFHIGWVGRISREKGADILIEALPALSDIKLHVTLIGDGVDRAELEHRVIELHLEDRVSFHGEIALASRLFPAFDLYVLSSRTEGTPITLFEAMHAAVPIVATSVGGVPDVVSSEDALLISPENPLALASAIRDVHDHPIAAARRASHARSRLERDFAAMPWLESYERIYRDAVAARARE
jgi:glycosyltransferase involved in cell wall biosynthesis